MSRKLGKRSNFDQTGKAVNIYPSSIGRAVTGDANEKTLPSSLCLFLREGPVVSGSLAVRESEISKETGIRELGGTCLSCGYRQSKAGQANVTRQCPPVEWQANKILNPADFTTRVELDRVSRE